MNREETKAYFKDIYDERPFHYDCVLGKLKLPWNDEIIDIFINYDVQNFYRPVVDSVYAPEGSCIYLIGDAFTEEYLKEYMSKVKEYIQHSEWIRQEKTHILSEVSEEIKQRLDPDLRCFIKGPDDWLIIHSESYALHYDPETKHYRINKYKSEKPVSSRYWWWNIDKNFNQIESDDRNTIIEEFINVIKLEISGVLLIKEL